MALVVAGRLLGVFELFVLGSVAVLLVVLAVLWTSRTYLRLDVDRQVAPLRVHAGAPSRVELKVRNAGPRRTPVLALFDPVSRTQGADLLLGPLEPLGTTRAAYRLPTEHRGIVRIGPLVATVGDPFGLAAVASPVAPLIELTVFPRVDNIVAVPQTTGHDPLAGAEHPTALGRAGEDFYGLRPYVVGDDLRRVHWSSTARRDELMVRQDELPWQGRLVVLLDVRRSTHSAESLERSVSAVASIVTASWKRRDLIRLITTDGTDSGFAAGAAQAESIMQHLAVLEATPGGSFRDVVNSLSRQPGGGGLVAVVAELTANELGALDRLRRRFASLTIVQFERTSDRPDEAPAGPVITSTFVRVAVGVPFAATWNATWNATGNATGNAKGSRVMGNRAMASTTNPNVAAAPR